MKLYFKILTVFFFTVLCYSSLTYFFGKKGFFAQKELLSQIEKVKNNVEDLHEIEVALSNNVLNLSYDYDTIKIYANKLGFVNDNEFMVKLVDYNANRNYDFNPGQRLVLTEIKFLPDKIIKTISASVGVFVILLQMIFGYIKNTRKYDY